MITADMDTVAEMRVESSEDERVRATFSLADRAVYVVADYDHHPPDIAAMLLKLQEKGWVPIPEDEEEPEVLDTGVRIRFRKIHVPHNRKIIPGLMSTPLLMGLGALMANSESWLQVAHAVVG